MQEMRDSSDERDPNTSTAPRSTTGGSIHSPSGCTHIPCEIECMLNG